MAGRKPKKGLEWFPHDTAYAADEDIEILIASYGQDGYAYPLHMYELAYKTRDGELDISDAEKRNVYARTCLIPLEKWEAITKTALKYHIWDPEAHSERHVLTSDRIKAQMAPVLEKRKKAKEFYEKKAKPSTPPKPDAEIEAEKVRNGQSREEKIILKNKEYVPPPEALRLAGVLATQILGNNPDNRELSEDKKEATVTRWAKDMDLMIRKDQRNPETVQKVILWTQGDDFWHKNILSAGKLRAQFDRLMLDMASDSHKKGKGGNGRHGTPVYKQKELDAIDQRREAERAAEQGATDGTGAHS